MSRQARVFLWRKEEAYLRRQRRDMTPRQYGNVWLSVQRARMFEHIETCASFRNIRNSLRGL